MALVKWDISISLLELGYDVLLLDPDLVLLRNPIPYFVSAGMREPCCWRMQVLKR